jgi:nitrogen fixation/metabolism regulation signal transduction histidine kinase
MNKFWTLRRVAVSVVVPAVLILLSAVFGPAILRGSFPAAFHDRLVPTLLIALPLLLLYLILLALVRMVREFRTGRIGSRFQARLLIGFTAVLLLSILPLYFVLSGLLRRSLDSWAMTDFGAALGDAYEWTRQQDDQYRNRLRQTASDALMTQNYTYPSDIVLAKVIHSRKVVSSFLRPGAPSDLVKVSDLEEFSVEREFFIRKEYGRQAYLVGYFPGGPASDRAVLALGTVLPKDFYQRSLRIEKAWLAYNQMDLLRGPFRKVLLLMMVVFLLFVLFIALVLSIVLSRQIARPVLLLYEGMHNIAAGRFDFTLDYGRKDEMRSLIQAFNNMAKELAFNQKAVLHSRHIEAWKKASAIRIEEARRSLGDFNRAFEKFEETFPDQDESVRKLSADLRASRARLEQALAGVEQFSSGPAITLRKEDLNDIVRDVMEMFQGLRSDVSFYVELDNSLPLLNINRSQMHQALVNLVKNALEALTPGSRTKGQVRVVTVLEQRLGGSVVRLDVADNGPGIPPENTERVFEPFFTTKSNKQGLGLTIVRRILEEHGGRVRFRRVDGRSVFTLEIQV